MRSRPLLTALTAVALLLTACGGKGSGDQAGSAGTTTSTASSSATGTGSSSGGSSSAAPSTDHHDGANDGDTHAAPFPADTNPDTAQPSAGASGNVTAIRIGHHDGFDRVVFEFHGTGTPGWTAQYVPQALGQGSGKPVPVAGKAVLSVAITGVGYPPDTGIREVATGRVAVAGTDVVTEVVFTGTFEGVSQAFVGTTARQPFRVYLLTAPARVVVEVVDR